MDLVGARSVNSACLANTICNCLVDYANLMLFVFAFFIFSLLIHTIEMNIAKITRYRIGGCVVSCWIAFIRFISLFVSQNWEFIYRLLDNNYSESTLSCLSASTLQCSFSNYVSFYRSATIRLQYSGSVYHFRLCFSIAFDRIDFIFRLAITKLLP